MNILQGGRVCVIQFMSRKSCACLYSEYTMKIGQDFFGIEYVFIVKSNAISCGKISQDLADKTIKNAKGVHRGRNRVCEISPYHNYSIIQYDPHPVFTLLKTLMQYARLRIRL